MFAKNELFLNRSTYGAGLSAVTAIDAGISVDLVLGVALSNSFNGARCSTSAAGDAIFSNLVCHGYVPPFICLPHYCITK